MPDVGAGERLSFVAAAREARRWIEDAWGGRAVRLTAQQLGAYTTVKVRDGWQVDLNVGGEEVTFHVLLPTAFPYALPRVALAQPNRFLVWPHVEEHGLLCLPNDAPTPRNSSDMVARAIEAADALVVANVEHVDQNEFRREFIPYWNRSCDPSDKWFWSLLTPDGPSRQVVIWRGKEGYYVGETEEQLSTWLTNRGANKPAKGFLFEPAVLAWLDSPPAPADFPTDYATTIEYLNQHSPTGLAVLNETAFQPMASVLMGARTESGVGIVGLTISGQVDTKLPGFRPGKVPASLIEKRWKATATIARRKVIRINASWIHGRESDPSLNHLLNKRVAILGVGALGSHIAVHLCQSGVGSLTLVDLQTLESGNVGRHVLGAEDIAQPKATALATRLSARFPHLNITGLHGSWERLVQSRKLDFEDFDLVVSAMGEWSAEGPLNDARVAGEISCPIVYGWLEQFAAAGHALLICSKKACLECVVDEYGMTRRPESTFAALPTLTTEPTCGTGFQPFGAVDLAQTDAIVCELALSSLLGKATDNVHRICAISDARLVELTGEWTDYHKRARPQGFVGSFVRDEAEITHAECRYAALHV